MRVIFQVVYMVIIAQVAFAALGPVAEPVCDTICPPDDPIVVNLYIPYSGDCSKFCHCANNGNWKKHCPANLHFNNLTKVCDWPEAAGCIEDSIADNSEVTEPSDSSKDGENGCNYFDCGPSACFETLNSIDCQHYCDCDHGNITIRECSKGLYYNPDTGNCDWEKNVVCHIRPSSTTAVSGSSSENITVPLAPTEVPSAFPGNCDKYCHCAVNGSWERKCPANLHFNPITNACDWPEKAQCVDVSASSSKALPTTAKPESSKAPSVSDACLNACSAVYYDDNSIMIPFPGNCEKYCHCAVNGNWERKCPANLHFNPITKACDWPEKAQCDEAPVSFEISSVASEPTEVPLPTGTCSDICLNKFSIKRNNYLAFPDDCTKFCHCANDGNWEKDCPSGLHFNQALEVCDWPADANCRNLTVLLSQKAFY